MKFENEAESVLEAARALGRQVIVVEAKGDGDIEAAFATLAQRQAGALMVGVVPHFTYNSEKIVALAARYKIPAMYPFPVYAFRGGLMSYGAAVSGTLRQVGRDYVSKSLKGAKPSDLPVKTAKALSLDVPPTLLALADEVIE